MAIDLAALTVPELLKLWSGTMSELQDRELVRTNNNPVGDLAEAIVHAHMGGERAGFSQKGWDIRTPDGERVQVKGMRKTATTKRRNLSAIRDADYDSVVVVVFDADFGLTETLKMTRPTVESLFPHRAYVNGRIITLTTALLSNPAVSKLDMSAAFARISQPRRDSTQ
ncbi:hypothetical protein [Antrihabitans stalactiti]|uniref:Uncharacterized protein n=1 Tax=Antrihabitans stalactiti TaxID=2584121 RepID=A0A848KI38_9NOCA|nr:hypothetical protein [Antrihabitans stalactiti]NMN97821.1 hypothetical protein [Antrihabitans stalactiti]